MKVMLNGGPYHGKTIDCRPATRIILPGSIEERRAVKDEDGDYVWDWAEHHYSRKGEYLGGQGGVYSHEEGDA